MNNNLSANEELIQQIEFLESLRLDSDLTEWEDDFVASCTKKLEKGFSFTAREVEKIEELYEAYDN